MITDAQKAALSELQKEHSDLFFLAPVSEGDSILATCEVADYYVKSDGTVTKLGRGNVTHCSVGL